MATIAESANTQTSRPRQEGYPVATPRFEFVYTILSVLLITGLFVDGWAHFHGRVDTSFFTPWHFIFYSAFALLAGYLALNRLRNAAQGHALAQSLPEGYRLALHGAILFAAGGVGDMIWHTLFGIESGSDALLSPTHLMLAIGMGLIVTAPIRSLWVRSQNGEALRGWRTFFSAICGAALLLALIMFFLSYAHPFVNPAISPAYRSERVGSRTLIQDYGVASFLLQAAVLSGIILPLLRRWRLPFGAITFMIGLSSLMLVTLVDLYILLPGILVGALVCDFLAQRINIQSEGKESLLFAFLLPWGYFVPYVITAWLTYGIAWNVHVWTGVLFLSGLVGVLVMLVSAPHTR